MKLTPEQFINEILSGKSEYDLNRTESMYVDPIKFKKLTSKRYGHTLQSAKDHLTTDYTDGFTICANCGSYYHLGNGFTKHLSNGCLHCEGESKHNTYWHHGNNERNYKTNPRWMAQMFDDGMHYCKDELEIEKYKYLVINKLIHI